MQYATLLRCIPNGRQGLGLWRSRRSWATHHIAQNPLCSDTFFDLSWESLECDESLEGENCSVTDSARICAGQPGALRCCQESSFCRDLICM